MVKVKGEGRGRLTERILRHHDAADVTEVGSECELSLKIPRESLVCDMGVSPFTSVGETTAQRYLISPLYYGIMNTPHTQRR